MSEPAHIGDVVSLDRLRSHAEATDRNDRAVPPAEIRGDAGTPPRVPPKYAIPLDALEQTTPVVKACTWFEERPTPGLLLVGHVGRGKSSIAGAIAMACQAPYRASFWPVLAMMRAMKAEFGQPLERKSIRQKLDERHMLVLDDVGTELDTAWQVTQLAEIVDHRYANELGLVVTTNLTARTLGERLDERTLSRLHGMCQLITVDGPDRRRGA